MAAIEVSHLTKEYRLGALQGIKHAAINVGRQMLRKPVERRPLFRALDDVSFAIEEGEIVGIIGHNGAGKSTLLKMLARISTPTSGRIHVNGRIAPLIEVGAGFVPDFTGRENVYLNCSILGMSHREVDRKFDEIVDFAEMHQFIDTPVKRYSSGMQVKLAFSVATSIDSEILIVDEVLAVGDLAFQRKCFNRIEGMIKNSSKTIIVVSHNLRQIARMCPRVIMMKSGSIVEDGESGRVCNHFYEYSNQKIYENQNVNKSLKKNSQFELKKLELVDKHGGRVDNLLAGEPLRVRLSFKALQKILRPEIIIGTHTTDFVYLTASSTELSGGWADLKPGFHEIELFVNEFPFKTGVYALRLAVFDKYRRPIFAEENLYLFKVVNAMEHRSPPLRLIDLKCKWKTLSEPLIEDNLSE